MVCTFIYIIYMHTSYIFIYMRYIDISSGERYVYIVWRNSELLLMLLAFAVLSGVPNPRDLMPDDLKCNLCNNNRNKVHNKCDVFESFPNHPSPPPVHGKPVFHKTSPWCQKDWGLLKYIYFFPICLVVSLRWSPRSY